MEEQHVVLVFKIDKVQVPKRLREPTSYSSFRSLVSLWYMGGILGLYGDNENKMEATILGGCQDYGPFLGTLNIRCRIIIGTQKGTINLTTTHIFARLTGAVPESAKYASQKLKP